MSDTEVFQKQHKDLEDLVKAVRYSDLYKDKPPSIFALEFVNFIKLVNGGKGEENKTPIVHYDMLDQILEHRDNLYVAARGLAKTSVIHEYMILYIAVSGGLPVPGFEDINVGMYVSDTMENGVKSLRRNLEHRFNNSEFLQTYIKKAVFTDDRWEFENADGHKFCMRGFGVTSGVRGFKEYGKRPTLALLDDLMSDKNANSPTVVEDIGDIIYGAVRQALHPKKRMVLWTGTPFNKKDPLYIAAGSSGWNTRVYPVCEKFPCKKEEFVGAWEDRFSYEDILAEYLKLLSAGKIEMFNRELMLRLISDEDRMIQETDIPWFYRDLVLRNKNRYNFYITTDFAVSDKKKADYTVIIVWAYTANGDWLLVDGVCHKKLMDENIELIFKYVREYNPFEVGIEISGQQKGFLAWLRSEMLRTNTFFNIAKDKNSREEGLSPNTNKFVRFNSVVPLFKGKKIWFPYELKESLLIQEALDELLFVTTSGIKSKNDDVLDNFSELPLLNAWKPTREEVVDSNSNDCIYGADDYENTEYNAMDSYIV